MEHISKKVNESFVSIYEEEPPYREIKKVLVNYTESIKIPSREYIIMCDLVNHILLVAVIFIVWFLSICERHRLMERGLYDEDVHIHWNLSVLIKKLLTRIYKFCVRAVKYIATEARSLLSLARARAVEYATKARAPATTTSATTTTTTPTTTSATTTTAAITTATTTTPATITAATATTTAATSTAATTAAATTTTATTSTATMTTATTTTATTTTATTTTATTTTDTKVATTDEAAANVDERVTDPNVALAEIVAANLAIANREDREAAAAYIAHNWDLVIRMNLLEAICFLSYYVLMYEVIMFIFWVLTTIEWL